LRPAGPRIGRGHRWTKSDLCVLLILHADRKRNREIARALGRPLASIVLKVHELNCRANEWRAVDSRANYSEALRALRNL